MRRHTLDRSDGKQDRRSETSRQEDTICRFPYSFGFAVQGSDCKGDGLRAGNETVATLALELDRFGT